MPHRDGHLLPHPTISFTLPSLHDDLVLDCRVYHPASLAFTSDRNDDYHGWRKRVAIVAHPYAPMGGSYDDPVLNIAAAAVLRRDWIVGTFNFRGAPGSKGRTSWTSKAEQADYASFVGFLAYYIHALHVPRPASSHVDSIAEVEELRRRTPRLGLPRRAKTGHSPELKAAMHSGVVPSPRPVLEDEIVDELPIFSLTEDEDVDVPFLLAGYSYGSLITMLLPELSDILKQFESPAPGSAAAEIKLRAKSLAAQQSLIMNSLFAAAMHSHETLSPPGTPGSPTFHRGRSPRVSYDEDGRRISSSIRVGGEETSPQVRKAASNAQKRSFSLDSPREAVRRSVDRVRGKTRRGRDSLDGHRTIDGTLDHHEHDKPPSRDKPTDAKSLPRFKEAYMLISPLQGMVSHLATMSLMPRKTAISPFSFDGTLTSHESKMVLNPTLAVYGDEDIFTSHRRLKAWAEKMVEADANTLKKQHDSQAKFDNDRTEEVDNQFTFRVVEGAGHFWHERGVAVAMREAVEKFVDGL